MGLRQQVRLSSLQTNREGLHMNRQERVPFDWIERNEVLLVWLVIAATILALSWAGLLS